MQWSMQYAQYAHYIKTTNKQNLMDKCLFADESFIKEILRDYASPLGAKRLEDQIKNYERW